MEKEKEELFRKIFDEHSVRILKFLLAMVADKEDALDMLQEVFSAFGAQFDKLTETPYTGYDKWLFAVARNKVCDYYKYKKRHPRPFKYDEGGSHRKSAYSVDYATVIFEKDLPPDEVLISKVLSSLSEKDRELYDLVFTRKKSYKELAERFNTNEVTVRMRVSRMRHRAKDKLKDLLK